MASAASSSKPAAAAGEAAPSKAGVQSSAAKAPVPSSATAQAANGNAAGGSNGISSQTASTAMTTATPPYSFDLPTPGLGLDDIGPLDLVEPADVSAATAMPAAAAAAGPAALAPAPASSAAPPATVSPIEVSKPPASVSMPAAGTTTGGVSAAASSSGAPAARPAASAPPHIPNVVAANRTYPAFLNKLKSMVDDPSTDQYICWAPSGKTFFVPNQDAFSTHVLPRFFKHNRFTSFVRQLNMYGFHKVPHLHQGALVRDDLPKAAEGASGSGSGSSGSGGASGEAELWEFMNENFQRDRPDLLQYVVRKRSAHKDNKKGARVDDADDEEDELQEIGGLAGVYASAAKKNRGSAANAGALIRPDQAALSVQDPNWPLLLLYNQYQQQLAAAGGAGASGGTGSNGSAAGGQNWDALMQNAAMAAAAAAAQGQGSDSAATGSADASSNGNSAGGNIPQLQITTLFNTLQSIQRAQSDITRDLHHLSSAQTRLWQEAMENSRRTKRQEETMNKIVKFLGSVFGIGGGSHNLENSDDAGVGNTASIDDFIGRFHDVSPGASGDAGSRSASAGQSDAQGSASSSALPPRRRGLMIEGPKDSPSPGTTRASKQRDIVQQYANEGLFEEIHDDPADQMDESTRFSEAISPRPLSSSTTPSPDVVSGAPRFTRSGSPSGDASNGRSRPAQAESPQRSAPLSSDALRAAVGGSPGNRRLSQQAQQQILQALSTDEGSAWLAQLLKQAPPAGAKAPAQQLGTADQHADLASTPGGSVEFGPKTMTMLQNAFASNSSNANDAEQQLAVALPRTTWDLQNTMDNTTRVQNTIMQLVDSLRNSDPASAAAISANQEAIAQGIQALGDANRFSAAASPAPSDGDADFLAQFLNTGTDGTGATPTVEEPAFAFSPRSSEAFMDPTSKRNSLADTSLPPSVEGRISTLSPESSKASTPAASSLQPHEGDSNASGSRRSSPRTKRKAELDSDAPSAKMPRN